MKTRSVKSSQVSALGSRSGDAEDVTASALIGEPPRAGGAELQPRRGRARPAVEQEGHRPGARVGAIELIGGVGDIGLRFALVVEQTDRAGGGGEVERPSGKRERVPGGRIRRQAVLFGGRRIRSVAARAVAPPSAPTASPRRLLGCGAPGRGRLSSPKARAAQARCAHGAARPGDWPCPFLSEPATPRICVRNKGRAMTITIPLTPWPCKATDQCCGSRPCRSCACSVDIQNRKIARVMTASIARSAGLTAVKILLIAISIRGINWL